MQWARVGTGVQAFILREGLCWSDDDDVKSDGNKYAVAPDRYYKNNSFC